MALSGNKISYGDRTRNNETTSIETINTIVFLGKYGTPLATSNCSFELLP